jgi:putative FmdB family regulatory protein
MQGEHTMPIYEYHCDACDKKFECLIMGSDKPKCPACGNRKVKRMMSACGFVSRGGGGETVSRSAGASSCTGCSATSCTSCGH